MTLLQLKNAVDHAAGLEHRVVITADADGLVIFCMGTAGGKVHQNRQVIPWADAISASPNILTAKVDEVHAAIVESMNPTAE